MTYVAVVTEASSSTPWTGDLTHLSAATGDSADFTAVLAGPGGEDVRLVARRFATWLRHHCGSGAPVMVSADPGVDAMWVSCLFATAGLPDPFTSPARSVRDLYAGLSGNVHATKGWERLRPGPDARGLATAFETILALYGQDVNAATASGTSPAR